MHKFFTINNTMCIIINHYFYYHTYTPEGVSVFLEPSNCCTNIEFKNRKNPTHHCIFVAVIMGKQHSNCIIMVNCLCDHSVCN